MDANGLGATLARILLNIASRSGVGWNAPERTWEADVTTATSKERFDWTRRPDCGADARFSKSGIYLKTMVDWAG
jgi:hypothetical protein